MKNGYRFWFLIGLIWMISTACDRLWWHTHNGLPSWDQADYLNSALDHGRALGLVQGGEWKGFKALLDLSPKIPPLASIFNGIIIALIGDEPSQAAWSLSFWNGLLLAGVALWGIHLSGKRLALLGVVFVAIAPAFLELRTNYVLEMPLAATVTLAMWQLSCWLGSRKEKVWRNTLLTAIACSASILTKQSSLLVLLPALLWVTIATLKHENNHRKIQLITGFSLVIISIIPWLKHNLITTLGGTNRAVIESAAKEGEPSIFSLANWSWYINILGEQLGSIMLVIGTSGCILWAYFILKKKIKSYEASYIYDNLIAWNWLIINIISAWVFTTIIPNKDPRYITPLLPAIILLLSRGWLQWGLWVKKQWPHISRKKLTLILVTGAYSMIPNGIIKQQARLNKIDNWPLKEIVYAAGGANPKSNRSTVIILPSTPDLNQHNFSYFGRMNGGNLVGRQLGNNEEDITPIINRTEWIVLAEGDAGSVRPAAAVVSQAIRDSNVFQEVKKFPRPDGGSYSLWKRNEDAEPINNFAKTFPSLANGLGKGFEGLERVFQEIGIEHMVDGHFKYREAVKQKALKRLRENPEDINAHWSLALIAVIANRPNEAGRHFRDLEELTPSNPWPSTYRSAVLLINWNPWHANAIATKGYKKHRTIMLKSLEGLSATLKGAFWRLPETKDSISKAYKEIEKKMN